MSSTSSGSASSSITGETRARYAGKRILLVGDGHSAATALVDLEALAKSDAPPSVTWIRRRGAGADTEPFEIQANDPLPERANLANRANRIAREAKWLATFAGAEIESYALKGAAVLVTIREAKGGMKQIEADQILALVGYRPDASIHRELQIHLCYASEAPMALATAMLTASIATPSADSDCLNQTTHGAETLRTPEPGFFLAGAKSYGRSANFLLSVGHRQIEEIYGLIETDVAAPSVLASP